MNVSVQVGMPKLTLTLSTPFNDLAGFNIQQQHKSVRRTAAMQRHAHRKAPGFGSGIIQVYWGHYEGLHETTEALCASGGDVIAKSKPQPIFLMLALSVERKSGEIADDDTLAKYLEAI